MKAAIHEGFNEVGLDNWRTHLASMGTDGASVNTGEQNGLIAIMRRDLPWLVGIWCVAHLFERGLLSSLKEEKFLTNIKEVLQGLYKHYQLSPKATKELKEVASALNENTLKPVNILGNQVGTTPNEGIRCSSEKECQKCVHTLVSHCASP